MTSSTAKSDIKYSEPTPTAKVAPQYKIKPITIKNGKQ